MPIFAIVEITGKQYRVRTGSELLVERLGKSNGEVVFDKVLLLAEDGQIKVGTPTVAGAQVVAKILGEERGKKITVLKYKAKSRYTKKKGFRPFLTRIRVEEIRTAPPKKKIKKVIVK